MSGDSKISALPASDAATLATILAAVQDNQTVRLTLQQIKTLFDTYYTNPFDPTNTATGVGSVTIDGNSGVAVYTRNIVAGTKQSFAINNSSITATSAVHFQIKYDQVNPGVPIFTSYKVSSGQITFWIWNIDSVDLTENISVEFIILPQ